MPEPRQIGPELRYAVERAKALTEHADALEEVTQRAERVWIEMIGHEVRILVFDGFSPRLAEQAAKNNLGVRKQSLDAELSAEVLRLSDELRKKLSRLMEDLEDGLLD